MRAFKIMIQSNQLAILQKNTETFWRNIYKKMGYNEKLNLGRWEHRHDERKKEIKSIWANYDHCGDHICGEHKVIKEFTNMKKTSV